MDKAKILKLYDARLTANFACLSVIGVPWFQGPVFLYPEDTKHLATTVFYEKEVFQGHTIVRQMSDVIGKCTVLHFSDYLRSRPTEIPEEDIFLYRCRYEEGREFWKVASKSAPKMSNKQVPADEWYFFKKPLQLWMSQGSPFLQEALQECMNAVPPSSSDEKTEITTEGEEEKEEEDTDTNANTPEVDSTHTEEMEPKSSVEEVAEPDVNENNSETTSPETNHQEYDGHERRIKFTNGYPFFLREKYAQFKKKFPNKTMSEVRRMIHGKWTKLDPAEQKSYHIKAREQIQKTLNKSSSKKAAEESEKNSKDHHQLRTNIVVPSILQIRVPKVKSASDQRGKHCRRGFNILVRDMHKTLKRQYPDKVKKELMKIIHAKWQTMDKTEQEAYHRRARETMIRKRQRKYGRSAVSIASMDDDEEDEDVEVEENGVIEAPARDTRNDRQKKKMKKALGYAVFMKEWYKEVSKQHPDKSRLEVYQLIHEKWDALPRQEQLDYNIRAKGGPLVVRKTSLKTGIRMSSAKAALAHRPKVVKVARAYSTGYNIYSKEVYQEIRKDNPGRSHTDVMRLVGQKWKSLGLDSQKQYLEKALTARGLPIPDGLGQVKKRRKYVRRQKTNIQRLKTSKFIADAVDGPDPDLDLDLDPDLDPDFNPGPDSLSMSHEAFKLNTATSKSSPFYRYYKWMSKRLSHKFKGKPKGSLKRYIVGKWLTLSEEEKDPYKEPYRIRRHAKILRLAEKMKNNKIKTVRQLLSEKRTDSEASGTETTDIMPGDSDSGEVLDLSRPLDFDENINELYDSFGEKQGSPDSIPIGRAQTRSITSSLKKAEKDSTTNNTDASLTHSSSDVQEPDSRSSFEVKSSSTHKDLIIEDAEMPQLEPLQRDPQHDVGHASVGNLASDSYMAPPCGELIASAHTISTNDQIAVEARFRELCEEDESLPLPGCVRLQMYSEDMEENISMLRCLIGRCDFVCNKRAWMKMHLQVEHKKLNRQRRSSCGSSSRSATPMSDSTTRSVMATPDKPLHTITDPHKLSLLSHFPLHVAATILKAEEASSKADLPALPPTSSMNKSSVRGGSVSSHRVANSNESQYTSSTARTVEKDEKAPHLTRSSPEIVKVTKNSLSSSRDSIPELIPEKLMTKIENNTTTPVREKKKLMESEEGTGPVDLTVPMKKRKISPEAAGFFNDLSYGGIDSKEGVAGLVIGKSWTVSPNEQHIWVENDGIIRKLNSQDGSPQRRIDSSSSSLPPRSNAQPSYPGHIMHPRDMQSSYFVSRLRGQTLEPFSNVIDKRNRGRPRRGISPDRHGTSEHLPSSQGITSTANSSDSAYASSQMDSLMQVYSTSGHGNSINSTKPVNSSAVSTSSLHSSRDLTSVLSSPVSKTGSSHQSTVSTSGRGVSEQISQPRSHSAPMIATTYQAVASAMQQGAPILPGNKDNIRNVYNQGTASDLRAPPQINRHSQIRSSQSSVESSPNSQLYNHPASASQTRISPAEVSPHLTQLLEKQNCPRVSNSMPSLIKVSSSRRPNNDIMNYIQGNSNAQAARMNLEPFTGIRDRTEALASLGLQRAAPHNQ
uniref:Uncharacterized protein LOC102809151 n=1 Tax=Saccoglossus kowalevskii TaxID=10224 RepID=A0ABM0LYZ6_SACKO|nr:PREDICTED: uncharacterized protein LOC102809151 [Saccoglossus kowalevskii]